MVWREVDVMVLGGAAFAPVDVLDLLRRLLTIPGVVGFDYHDERGPRSPTGEARDERYHLTIHLVRPPSSGADAVDGADGVAWAIDLSIWLYDDHANVTRWHEDLRESITAEQRQAVLRIKDVWHRLPSYPDQVGGLDVYTAVIDGGVRTPDQFEAWLAERH